MPWIVVVVLAASALGRVLLAAVVGVAPDEAYYWSWALEPAFGYPDHPPAVAWLLAPFAPLAVEDVLWLRLPALVAGGVAMPLLLWWLAGEVGISSSRRWWVPLALVVQPLGWAMGLLVTPDVPLIVAWTGCSLLFFKALRTGQWRFWTGVGILAGLALLSKHSGWILLTSLGITLWAEPRPWPSRRWRQVSLALALCLLLAAPNLWWDSRAGFSSLGFQLSHGLRPTDLWGGPLRFLEFVGGQVGLLTPIVAGGVLWFLRTARRGTEAERRLFHLAWPTLAVFAAASWLAHPEANWPAPAHPLLLTGLVVAWDRRRSADEEDGRFRGGLPLLAVGVSGIVTAIAAVHLVFPLPWLPPGEEPAARLRGWRQLPGWFVGESVFAPQYELAAALRYHLPRQPRVPPRCPEEAELPSALLAIAVSPRDLRERAGGGPGESRPESPADEGGVSPQPRGRFSELGGCSPEKGRCWRGWRSAVLRREDGHIVRTVLTYRSGPCQDSSDPLPGAGHPAVLR